MTLPSASNPVPNRRRWRDSLQGQLITSHCVVIFAALGLVILSSAIFLFRYERVAERERLSQLAVPLMAEVNIARFSNQSSATRPRIQINALDAQAEAMGIRILIVDTDGSVRYDTAVEDDLRKQALPGYAATVATLVTRSQQTNGLQYVFFEPRGNELFAGKRILIAAGKTGAWKSGRALMIVSDRQRFPLLSRLLPRLLGVTAVSLFIASLLGYMLSRRIAKPVHRLVMAADAMAAGVLEQEVPGARPDEIGRLVSSFNTMSRQVSATYTSQRELLADVAHELRTPLTSIQGYAQALRDGVIEESSQRQQALAIIGRESDRMGNLIVKLLDLARLESGQAALLMSPVHVATLLARIEDRLRPEAAFAQTALMISAPADLFIRGDDGRLMQIVSNLVSNSIRHTPKGGLISITACAVGFIPAGGTGVRLIVHDTGEGIPPERLPHIFKRFERGGIAAVHPNQGFGLGLAIVSKLVSLHHGTINVRSEPGRGTTFTVDLPSAGSLSTPPAQPKRTTQRS